ncbi:MAG: hypothetical protein A3F24_02475 [Candidatus Colwellbacteria bacterium RIFCSPHIGHO2_12_FULL_44_17]|uniref:Uncharacterized protein n=2 Tax=Candidatus Colwelliibacteriota TaxID=1817904 RepID=A0A1G1Z9R8_9BACT|nr:MAG: hypothetical protein A3F24_02475 [Candidatus Colwellbacteria bacterium RIFCSPHIGHO2_12_FULL_44_17]OGY60826.1 MAG: hypothetical protein A3I31_01460 [Candidatus Colwellbacteria bacterium RIFCSPLOWO2_02_FULL_44_20b]
MKLLILTGPAGAGKNTIAELAAKKREKCAVIDVDTIRWFLRNPHKAPWEGEEGKTQQFLGVKNACTLAENFLKENCDVIILDVINDETAKLYRELLKNHNPKILLLLPSFEEIQKRNTMRPPRLRREEIEMIYKWQESLTEFDERIDNSNLSAEEAAESFLKNF